MSLIYRKNKIIELCTGKTVLHLGFINHAHLYQKLIHEGKWLHSKLAEVSSKLVGIDYLEEEVKIIRKKYGYEVYYADVMKLEKLDYHYKFEVIICGELIEHLDNPGLMLDGLKRFMTDSSILIITTPNPWSRNRIKLILSGKKESEWLNPEHSCWFSYQTLKQLLERKGYIEVKYTYYYGDIEGETINGKNLLLKKYLQLKQKYFRKKIPEIQYNGLFFQSKLKSCPL